MKIKELACVIDLAEIECHFRLSLHPFSKYCPFISIVPSHLLNNEERNRLVEKLCDDFCFYQVLLEIPERVVQGEYSFEIQWYGLDFLVTVSMGGMIIIEPQKVLDERTLRKIYKNVITILRNTTVS